MKAKKVFTRIDTPELKKYHTFKCSKCGCRQFVKVGYNGEASDHFYEGHFMCYGCGTSINHGEVLNYYNDSFTTHSYPQQLTLNFDL